MVEGLNGYFSSAFTREDIRSLPVPDAKFQKAKLDFLGQLIVTSEIVSKKITRFTKRFNNICHPSQRPRWQVDKEAIGLSGVQQSSSACSPPS